MQRTQKPPQLPRPWGQSALHSAWVGCTLLLLAWAPRGSCVPHSGLKVRLEAKLSTCIFNFCGSPPGLQCWRTPSEKTAL